MIKKELKEKNNIIKSNKGITLVVLIITIVVLIVLTAVTISNSGIGKGSLISRSEQAKIEYEDAKIDEEDKIKDMEDFIQPTPGPEKDGFFYETSIIAEISPEEKTRKAPIPVGYKVSQIEGENTIKNGLVFYQIPDDANVDWDNNTIAFAGSDNAVNLQENVNQFVWIPVDDINDMIMCKKNANENGICNLIYEEETNNITCSVHGYTTSKSIESLDLNTEGLAGRIYSRGNEPKGGTYEVYNNVKYQIYSLNIDFSESAKGQQKYVYNSGKREPSAISKDISKGITDLQLNQDFITMAKSVAKYKGFFVARYETSSEIKSQKNKTVLTNLDWYGLYNNLRNNAGKVITGVSGNTHMVWRMSI